MYPTTNNPPRLHPEQWRAEMASVIRKAKKNFDSREGSRVYRILTEKYAISKSILAYDLRCVYLPNCVQIGLPNRDEGTPQVPFFIDSEPVSFGPGLLFPLRGNRSLGGAVMVTEEGRIWLVKGSRDLPIDIGFRPNRPLVLVQNPVYAAALAMRLGDKVGVRAMSIPRGPRDYELTQLQDVPCIYINQEDFNGKGRIAAWEAGHPHVRTFEWSPSMNFAITGHKLLRRIERSTHEVRTAPISSKLHMATELRHRIMRLDGSLSAEKKHYCSRDQRDEGSHWETDLEEQRAEGESCGESGVTFLAYAERDGVCHVADASIEDSMLSDTYLFRGPLISARATPNHTSSGDLLSLEGAASFLVGEPMSYEDAVREYLGDVLDDRDLELLLHCDRSLAELAGFRAVVNNLLLLQLEEKLRASKKLKRYNKAVAQEELT